MGCGSEIQNPRSRIRKKPIWDPGPRGHKGARCRTQGVIKTPDPVSGSATLLKVIMFIIDYYPVLKRFSLRGVTKETHRDRLNLKSDEGEG
jgi:hypothetical protein